MIIQATICARFLMKICLQKCCQTWDQVCEFGSGFEVDWIYIRSILENAWPRNPENPDYVEKGEIIKIGDMEMYVVGEGPNAIIWNYGRN